MKELWRDRDVSFLEVLRGKQVAARKKTLNSQKVEASCTVLEKG